MQINATDKNQSKTNHNSPRLKKFWSYDHFLYDHITDKMLLLIFSYLLNCITFYTYHRRRVYDFAL